MEKISYDKLEYKKTTRNLAFFKQPFRKLSQKSTKNATRTLIPAAALGALGYICYKHYYRVVEREERKAGVYREVKPFGPLKVSWRKHVQ